MEDNTRHESSQQAQQAIDKLKQEKVVYSTARSCSLVNGLLVVFKLIAGIMGMSLAMMADAVHSLSDYLTDLLIMYRLRMERKPKNDEHDYGYGRVAVLAAGVTGIALFILGILLFYMAIERMVLNFSDFSIPRPGLIALIAALVSIAVKALTWLIVSRAHIDRHHAWHSRRHVFRFKVAHIGPHHLHYRLFLHHENSLAFCEGRLLSAYRQELAFGC